MAQIPQQRRQRAQFSDEGSPDRLPPHSEEAEQGVLGCCLLGGAECVREASQFFQGKAVWFDLRHEAIFRVLVEMEAGDEPVDDFVLVHDRLKAKGQLEEAGGLVYLNSLPDTVPSAANQKYYLGIVFDKYICRRILHAATKAAATVYEHEGEVWTLTEAVERDFVQIKAIQARNTGLMPARLKDLSFFEAAYMDIWFGSMAGEPGLLLPPCFGDFPFKIRHGEMSFLIAEKGAGKSTLLSYILLHLLGQGERACIASMEMKPEVTIKMMAAQLLGRRELPDNEWGHKQARLAYDWLRPRLLIYDFTGIAEWREILAAFDFASLKGFTQFQIDSVMRLGIADDDYAEQGMAARSLANWALTHNAHLWVVNHLNKSDRSTKQRSRGSQQWIDNSNNVLSVHMNEEKGLFIEGAREELRLGQISHAEFEERIKSKSDKFDSYFDLHNQRWPGSRQNGRRYLFFDRDSLQLQDRPFGKGENFLLQFSPPKKTGEVLTTDGHG